MKKCLALIIALAMVMSMIPSTFAAEITFGDVKKGGWQEQSVLRWAQAGILNGRSEGVFAPNEPITRGEFAKVLSEILGLTEEAEEGFTDLNTQKWYAKYILRCKEAGIMNGNTDGTVKADSNITRQEAFAMLARTLKMEKGTAEDLADYQDNDAADISGWAIPEVAAVINYKAVQGDTYGNLNPKANITRAEVTVILDRIIGVYVDREGNVSTTSGKQADRTGNFVVINEGCEKSVTIDVPENSKITVTVEDVAVTVHPTNEQSPTVVVGSTVEDLTPEVDATEYAYILIAQESTTINEGETLHTVITGEYDPETRTVTAQRYENDEYVCTIVETYDASFNLIRQDTGDGMVLEFEYDENGNMVCQKAVSSDGTQQITTLTYNEQGLNDYQKIVATNNGEVYADQDVYIAYDDNGNPIKYEIYSGGDLGQYSIYEYDERGAYSGSKTYDGDGNLIASLVLTYDEESGERIGTQYDAAGEITNVQTNRYNENGDVIYWKYVSEVWEYSMETEIEYLKVPLN